MSIKDRLDKKIEQFKEEEQKKIEEDDWHEKNDIKIFQPISDAMTELANEYKDSELVEIHVHNTGVTVKLKSWVCIRAFVHHSQFTISEEFSRDHCNSNLVARKDAPEFIIEWLLERIAKYLSNNAT